MNNNIKKAQALVNCFNKNNPNITYTCYVPSPTSVATITIGTTTTTAPGTNASVTNVGTKTNAILNFSIPRGEPGTSTTSTPAYASIYNNTQTPITLNQGAAATPVTLGVKGLNNNVDNQTANKLTITAAGDYKIEYFLAASSNTAATLTLDVKNNGTQIVGSNVSEAVGANESTRINGVVLANLQAGSILELDVSTSANTTITPADGTNAYLIVTKLN